MNTQATSDVTPQRIHDMLQEVSTLMDEAIRAAAHTDEEGRRIAGHARMRLREAAMLLDLTTGKNEPIHYSLGALMRAVFAADKRAKQILNVDIDLANKSEEEFADILNLFELATIGYYQWRCLSSLALMHLSQSLMLMERIGK